MKKYFLLIAFSIFCFSELQAQTTSYDMSTKFTRLDIENMLPQNTVLSIYQDGKGFMWFGTYSGLCRYDGNNVKIFLNEKNNNRTINSGTITAITGDNAGRIYLGTTGGGLNVFDTKTETFTYYMEGASQDSLLDNMVYDIFIHGDDVWLACSLGFCKINLHSNKTKYYHLNADNEASNTMPAYRIFVDSKNRVWAGTLGQGLYRLNQESDTFIQSKIKVEGYDSYTLNSIKDILEYDEKQLLIGTNAGSILYNTDTEECVSFYQVNNPINNMLMDSKKNVWIGTLDLGLILVTPDGNKQVFSSDPGDISSLPENDVRSLYEDSKGQVWIGLHTFGLVVTDRYKKPFYHLYYKHDQPSIMDNGVFSLECGNDGDVWIGTLKGVNRWKPSSNTFEPVLDDEGKDLFSDKMIWTLYKDTLRNTMWMGYSSGLSKYNLETKKVQQFSADDASPLALKSNEVFSFSNDSTGTMWIGTYTGLFKYNYSLNGFDPYKGLFEENEVRGAIWRLFTDSQGRLWVGSNYGLYIYNYKTEQFEQYFKNVVGESNYRGVEVLNITEDDQGYIWLSTPEGLVRIDTMSGETLKVGFEHGLSNENIYAAINSGDFIWASSNRGISKVNMTDLSVVNYNHQDGLQADEFSLSVKKTDNGMLLFGGVNGVTAFYPDSIKASKDVPEIYFNELQLNGDVIYPNEVRFKHQPLRISILEAKTIEVSHKEKLITLNFSALDFSYAAKKIKYRYRILPQSDNWINIVHEPTVNLINLMPGTYLLEVESTNVDQDWGGNTKTLSIKIHPPFYRTFWFYALVLLSIILSIVWIMSNRTRLIKQQNLRLESAVKKRTLEVYEQKEQLRESRDEIAKQKQSVEKFAEELEVKVENRTAQLLEAKERAEESDRLKSSFLANMSHEIRTPMNAIVGFSELLRFNDISVDERSLYVELVRTNSENLLHLLNDILDISVIESGKITLHKEDFLLLPMLNKVFQSFESSPTYIDKPEISLRKQFDIPNDLVIDCDKARLSQVLHNLLSNAIKYTREGTITFSGMLNENGLLLKVEDTGIGIKEAYLEKVFERFHKVDDEDTTSYRGGGLGLSISKNLTNLMGGRIWVDSTVGKGSIFYVELPKSLLV